MIKSYCMHIKSTGTRITNSFAFFKVTEYLWISTNKDERRQNYKTS